MYRIVLLTVEDRGGGGGRITDEHFLAKFQVCSALNASWKHRFPPPLESRQIHISASPKITNCTQNVWNNPIPRAS